MASRIASDEDLKVADLLTKQELAAVDRLGAQKDLSRLAVIRQALRLYETVSQLLDAGETMTFSGDAGRKKDFRGPL